MDSKLTYKQALILSTLAAISVKNDKIDISQNALIIITAAGIITGTYVSKEMANSLNDDVTYAAFISIDKNAKEKFGDSFDFILLKDVTMITSMGVRNSFKCLHVFIDEIIALSFGNISQN